MLSKFVALRLREIVRVSLLATVMAFAGSFAHAQPSLKDAIAAGRPIIDLRQRYETVDQSNRTEEAHANTFRARLGYQTGSYRGFTAIAEFDWVQHVGGHTYCDTVRNCTPATKYPVVPDPDLIALNRLQLGYAFALAAPGTNDSTIAAGRQRIVFADQRFVGNVAWRQHEQTFDAVSLVNNSLPKTMLTYAYVSQVNRVVGERSITQAGYYDSSSHLMNALYSGFMPYLRLEAYSYLLDLKQAPTLSTASYGLRGEGRYEITPGLFATLTVAYARQNAYANNPLSIDLDYRSIEGGASYRGFSLGVGHETLAGNGTAGFSTPLATLHAFQGWADVFLITPVHGIKDSYAKAGYSIATPPFANVMVSLVYHEFSAQRISADYGGELDAIIEARLDDNLSFGVKYANYRAGADVPIGAQAARFNKTISWLYVMYRY
jgi:hypothetical protein